MIRKAGFATLVALVVGCHGKGDAEPQKAPPSQPKVADAKTPTKAEPGVAKQPPSRPPTLQKADAAPDAKVADAKADPLGKRFIDPPWFRKEMFGDGATVFKASRGEADEKGLFASQITFNLAEGVSVEDCEKLVNEKVGKHVGKFEREVQHEGKRIFLRATTDRMKVTCVCGDNKGTTRAYVAYEWTS